MLLPEDLKRMIPDTKKMVAFIELYDEYIILLDDQFDSLRDGLIETSRAYDNAFIGYSGVDLVVDYMLEAGILESQEAYNQLGGHISDCFERFIDRTKALEEVS